MAEISNREINRMKQKELAQAKEQRREREKLEREARNKERAAERSRSMREHLEKCSWIYSIEEAPVYRPSPEEFADPTAYILSIREEASKYGICKIIPPYPATTNCFKALRSNGKQKNDKKDALLRFPTRQQVIRDLGWDDFDRTRFWSAPPRNLNKYAELADSAANKVFGSTVLMPTGLVESEYWRHMAIPFKGDERSDLTVEYGDNVEGTGFSNDEEDLLGSSDWNLNALPMVAKSTLRLLKGAIPGVTEPMLYLGMLFATFSWHIEDLYLYSINFHHAGAPKTWYGVPSSDAQAFEKVVLSQVYKGAIEKLVAAGASQQEAERKALGVLLQKTTIFTPERLLDAGVRTVRCTQHAGEFVVTFPRAYHSGFSNGYNLGEAVNFALRDWFPYGADCAMRMRYLRHLQAVPLEQLLCLEMEVLHNELKAKADGEQAPNPNDSANDSPDTFSAADAPPGFAAWLAEHGDAAVKPSDRPLVTTFCQLARWQHRRTQALLAAGAKQTVQQFDNSVPCSRCRDMCFLSFVMKSRSAEPYCLRCCQQPDDPPPPAPPPAAAPDAAVPPNPAAPPPIEVPSAPVPAFELTVFCHHKILTYHKLGATYSALARLESWRVSAEQLRAEGLTDRFEIPPVCKDEQDDYTAEDMAEDYEWAGSVTRSPNSCKSDTDTLTLLDIPADGELLGVLNDLLPEQAVERPLPPLGKSGKVAANKGGKAARKILKVVSKGGAGTPPVRARKPSLASIQYAENGGDTEPSGSLNAPELNQWQEPDGTEVVESVVKQEPRAGLPTRKSQPSPKPTVARENSTGLDPSISRGNTQDEEDDAARGGRKRPTRAAADAAAAMWKVGGRIAPEDALAADDMNRQAAKRQRKAAQSGSKRSEEHSGDSNLGGPKGSAGTAPQSMRHMSDLSKGHLGTNGGKQGSWLMDDAMHPAMMGAAAAPSGREWLSSPPPGGAANAMRPARGAPSVPQHPNDPWLNQLEYSAGLNNELAKLLDYFCNLAPVEITFPQRAPSHGANTDPSAMDLNSSINAPLHDQMGAHLDRRQNMEIHSMQQQRPVHWPVQGHGGRTAAGSGPTRGGSQRDNQIQMMHSLLSDPPAQMPQRSGSQMLGHSNQQQIKLSDVDPLSSMTLPFIGGGGAPDAPQSPGTSSQGRNRPRSRQGGRGSRGRPVNSGSGLDLSSGMPGAANEQKPPAAQGAADPGMGRGGNGNRSKLPFPVNMPSLATNLSMPGSMEMNVSDFNDTDTGDFTDFMKLLGSDNHDMPLEGIGL